MSIFLPNYINKIIIFLIIAISLLSPDFALNKFYPKYNFKELINEMLVSDLKLAKQEFVLKKNDK